MENESNLKWLLCDAQLRGKTLIRYGKRKEVSPGNEWVFCPLRPYPRDRVSVKNCEKCKHFKGYRKVAISQQFTDKLTKDFKPTMQHGKRTKQTKTIALTDEDFENLNKKQKEWEQKEMK